jgi:hypothetical protein
MKGLIKAVNFLSKGCEKTMEEKEQSRIIRRFIINLKYNEGPPYFLLKQ